MCRAGGGGPAPAGGDEPELDVSVFRFTLGIPGFEDRLIPRAVGFAGAALLALNRALGATVLGQPVSDAQVGAHGAHGAWLPSPPPLA